MEDYNHLKEETPSHHHQSCPKEHLRPVIRALHKRRKSLLSVLQLESSILLVTFWLHIAVSAAFWPFQTSADVSYPQPKPLSKRQLLRKKSSKYGIGEVLKVQNSAEI